MRRSPRGALSPREAKDQIMKIFSSSNTVKSKIEPRGSVSVAYVEPILAGLAEEVESKSSKKKQNHSKKRVAAANNGNEKEILI